MLDHHKFPASLLQIAAGLAVSVLLPGIVHAGKTEQSFEVPAGVRQLFLDDVGIEQINGLTRVVNSPNRHPANPLLKPDMPWERGCQVYGTSYYDEQAGLFKLWYLTGPKKDRGMKPLVVNGIERPPHTTLVAYAESKDGILWTKPNLGLFPFDGDKNNNLLLLGSYNAEGVSVLHDPQDPDPTRRWKAFFWDHGTKGWHFVDGRLRTKPGPKDGIWVAFSPDGIHWTHYEGNPVIPKYSDTNQVVLYDPKIERYVAYGRFGFGRRTARSESKDFVNWSEPKLVMECDAADGPNTQIYGVGVDIYEGIYLAMVWIYRQGIDGKIDTQLATSRDGIHWTRVGNRKTWLELGDDDSWEGGMIRSTEGIIRRGDRLYIYYCGVHGPHSGPKFPKVERKYPVMIGLATQRRDGFVSLDAGPEEGHFISKPFALPSNRLFVNANARDGRFRVEVLDRDGQVLTESETFHLDYMRAEMSFDKDLPAAGTTVKLRITARNTKLYSYWFQ